MCVKCVEAGVHDCLFVGYDCMSGEYEDEEFYDQTPVGVDVYESGICESESMSKKAVEVEVVDEAPKGAIIKKQSEVWVWNDQVFASYEGALAASFKSEIVNKLMALQYNKKNGYSAAQVASYVNSAMSNPMSYNVAIGHVLEVFKEYAEKLVKDTTA